LFTKRKIHKNHQPRSKELRRRCKQHWIIEKKVAIESPRNAFKRKNRVEGGTSSS
jgi:hypothetical protein